MKKVKYMYPNIVAEMARNGDTLQTLGKKIGMNYQTLSARLRGKKAFELPEIYILMKVYGKSFEELFTTNEPVQRPA